ncbi:hypothetical protein QA601_10370 [Chitinispirillales bacterium ANBcel5]|uniref:hypothetical protein n=1 Tax=Cellulosispirillum alkaliphilum TaxID=3039283 RepID=UPI002A4FB24E|nr:hypothetical protein [Chitinispirillales bacterium ANBcel5]
MLRNELIKKSPLRILEKSTHDGVGAGNIGVLAARKGVGKTACLVHIATDQLLQKKHVIHVSFASDTSHIVAWYEDIFKEIAQRYKLDNYDELHDESTRNRVIMNFKQYGDTVSKVQNGIRALVKDGHFSADMIIVDGFDFSKSSPEEFQVFKNLAEELNIEVWFSATVRRDDNKTDENGIPLILKSFQDNIAILIQMEPHDTHVHLHLIKDHDIIPAKDDLHLKLDPQTLLIAEEG